MITLYGMPRSRSLRVSWALEELELTWQYKKIRLDQGEHRQPSFKVLNPAGKLPVLQDGKQTITESAAICLYLAEKYNDKSLLPHPSSSDSARHHQWISFILTELEQPLWNISKHSFILPKEQRIGEMLPLASQEFEHACETACHWLSDGPYLLNDQFTVADILLTHTLNWAITARQSLPEPLNSYRKRVSRRPALASALEKELSC